MFSFFKKSFNTTAQNLIHSWFPEAGKTDIKHQYRFLVNPLLWAAADKQVLNPISHWELF